VRGGPLVLADASPLIALANVEGLPWLHGLFGRVSLTAAVRGEAVPGQGRPGEREIAAAIQRGWLEVIEGDWADPGFADLDEGEAATLRAAVNLRQPCLILRDERAGRAVARELGFPVTGTAGVILAAKRRGLIPAVKPVFEQLLRKDFRLSAELIRAVLAEAGEK
jgi:predicted nucleic acid-binding protein